MLITSTYACNSNRLAVTFKLWFSIANLNADCTSSVPFSKIAPVNEEKKAMKKWENNIRRRGEMKNKGERRERSSSNI